ncbi:MAG: transporter permease [Patescibacteria group bacterium]|nr:transporter permease [Patescibacteria group bacterium]
MKFTDIIIQALKNLKRQKLRSALTIFAVMIGATSVTIMLALVTGAQSFFVSQFSANGTLQQIAISSQTDLAKFDQGNNGGGSCDSCVKLTDALVTKIKAVPHVIGVARRVSGGSLESVTYNGTKLRLQQVEGYDANGILTNTMLAGRDIAEADKDGVITITSDYADKWGFKGHYSDLLNKPVQMLTRNGYSGVGATIALPPQQGPDGGGGGNDPQQQPPTTLTATIVGIVDGGDRGETVRAPLAWVNGMNTQRMYQMTDADRKAQDAANRACQNNHTPCQPGQPKMTLVSQDFLTQNGYNGFTAKVDDVKNAATTTAAIKKLGVGAADAQSLIKQQLQIFNIISLVLGGIGGIALLVAAIGVVNTMVMAILERTREIGVLRACGATRATIRSLFTIEASALGFLGGAAGVAAGYGLTLVANRIINAQLGGSGLAAHNIITLPLWLIASVIGIATLIGMLAGLYPAFRASRLNPIDALRYE